MSNRIEQIIKIGPTYLFKDWLDIQYGFMGNSYKHISQSSLKRLNTFLQQNNWKIEITMDDIIIFTHPHTFKKLMEENNDDYSQRFYY